MTDVHGGRGKNATAIQEERRGRLVARQAPLRYAAATATRYTNGPMTQAFIGPSWRDVVKATHRFRTAGLLRRARRRYFFQSSTYSILPSL